MLDLVLATFEPVRDGWREKAADRRALTAVDPAADVLEHCVKDIDAAIAKLRAAAQLLTTLEYAQLHHVTRQAVAKWCRRGEIAGAQWTEGGWRIPREARRVRRARRVAANEVGGEP